MLELEAALERILAAIPPPQSERVPLTEADGRVLAESIRSPLDLPPFDNSSMDGYAVRAADVVGANDQTPVRLRLAGKVAAGQNFPDQVNAGSCVRIFTGSPIPAGTDAVVMQEDTRAESVSTEVSFLTSAEPGENVRYRGEDVRQGQALVEKGRRLGPGQLSLLAAVGIAEVSVGRRPIVGLLATGSELREPGLNSAGQGMEAAIDAARPVALQVGQIYESNRLGLAALAGRAGAIAKILPLVPDHPELTREALDTALRQCNFLVTSGGVSVGEMDFVKQAFKAVGGELDFWKVSIKPGRPFVFGRRGEQFLFGLPGNPVSALVTLLLLVRPVLLRWQGASELALSAYPGRLAEPLVNDGSRRHFMRVKVDHHGGVYSAGMQASHVLSSLAAANGLVDVPPETTWPAGKAVSVLRWD